MEKQTNVKRFISDVQMNTLQRLELQGGSETRPYGKWMLRIRAAGVFLAGRVLRIGVR